MEAQDCHSLSMCSSIWRCSPSSTSAHSLCSHRASSNAHAMTSSFSLRVKMTLLCVLIRNIAMQKFCTSTGVELSIDAFQAELFSQLCGKTAEKAALLLSRQQIQLRNSRERKKSTHWMRMSGRKIVTEIQQE